MPLRKLLTFPVVLSISNHITLALMDMMFISLLPLFMAMPVELGGLGFTPLAIGYVLGILGVWRGLFAILFLARLIRKFGERQAFIVGMLAFNVNFITLPLINIAARRTGVMWVVWCFLTFSLSLTPMIDMCWGKPESRGRGNVLTESRLYNHFHYSIISEQTLARRYKWHLGDNRIDRTGYWSYTSNITLLVLRG